MRWIALVVWLGVAGCTPSVRPPDVGSSTTPVAAGPTAPAPPRASPTESSRTPTRDVPLSPAVPSPVAESEETASEPIEAPLPEGSEAVPPPDAAQPSSTVVPTDGPQDVAAAPAPDPTPSPVPTVEPRAEPTPSLAETAPPGGDPVPNMSTDPTTELVAALQAQAQAPSFRVHETVSGPGGTMEYRIAYAAPDRFHLLGSDGSEAIVVGPDLYPRRPEGDWVLTPGAGLPIAARFIGLREPAMLEQFRQTIPNVTFRGSDMQEGTPTRVYHYTLVAEGAVNASTETTVWVAVSHGRPVRVETTSTVSLPEQTVTTSSVLRFSDYGAAIAIQAPF